MKIDVSSVGSGQKRVVDFTLSDLGEVLKVLLLWAGFSRV